MNDLTVPDDDVRSQLGAGNVLEKVEFLPWQVGSDLQSIRQMASNKVDNDLQHTVVPSGVASQVKGLLAGVQDVCDENCPMWTTLKICSHCVAVAHSMGCIYQ